MEAISLQTLILVKLGYSDSGKFMGTSHRSLRFLYSLFPNTVLNWKTVERINYVIMKTSFLFYLWTRTTVCICIMELFGFLGGAVVKKSARQCRRRRRYGFDPGLGRSPGGGNGNPLQYSCLEKPMNRGAWWATVHGGHEESDITEQLSMLLF